MIENLMGIIIIITGIITLVFPKFILEDYYGEKMDLVVAGFLISTSGFIIWIGISLMLGWIR